MKYLEALVEMPARARHPMQEFCRRSDAMGRVELITWNATGAEDKYAFFRIEGDVEAYRDRIEAVESIRRYNLTPIDDGSFYSYVVQETREADRRWRRAFASRNLVVVPPIVYDEATRMRLTVVGDAEDLRALVGEFPEGFSLAVEEVGEYDRRRNTVAAGLTERQRAAVEAAVEVGYYAVPREAGLEAVADELGCAESTASNHLRKAEELVMRRLVRRGWV
jgi:predicted DNA binding protein